MRFLLLKMKINGIKNIDKEIELSFSDTIISNIKKSFERSNVKAIYGSNGAGKTGIMHAVNIYKNLLLNEDYLAVENANNNLNDLINQKNKKFTIEMIFSCVYEEDKKECISTFSHYICIKKVESSYKLVEEKLSEIKGNINCQENFSTICHAQNNTIININKQCSKYEQHIKNNTMNLLYNNSFVRILSNSTSKNIGEYLSLSIVYILLFAFNLTIVLQDSDINYINFNVMSSQIESIRRIQDNTNEKIFGQMLLMDKIPKSNSRKILKKEIKKFEQTINNLTKFIKVFKKELKSIEIKKIDNDKYYECDLILVYNDDRKINEKFESSGIKKIIALYNALYKLENGGIVFIDEFDSNIHDVLLMKIVEYIEKYTKGQFVFTTHNLGPMEILKNKKHGIDFLSDDSRVASWTKNGNYSPVSLYRKGLIDYSPFNIEAFNFIGSFGDDYE